MISRSGEVMVTRCDGHRASPGLHVLFRREQVARSDREQGENRSRCRPDQSHEDACRQAERPDAESLKHHDYEEQEQPHHTELEEAPDVHTARLQILQALFVLEEFGIVIAIPRLSLYPPGCRSMALWALAAALGQRASRPGPRGPGRLGRPRPERRQAAAPPCSSRRERHDAVRRSRTAAGRQPRSSPRSRSPAQLGGAVPVRTPAGRVHGIRTVAAPQ